MLQAQLPVEKEILSVIEGAVGLMGYDIARVKLRGGEDKRTLQIMIDRKDGKGVNVDDCAAASGQISALLDVHDPLDGAYDLEVSSPGIDRPLTRPADFIAYKGFDIRAETRAPLEGRRRFKGVLTEADESGFAMETAAKAENGEDAAAEIRFAYGDLAGVNLIYSDDLARFVAGREAEAEK